MWYRSCSIQAKHVDCFFSIEVSDLFSGLVEESSFFLGMEVISLYAVVSSAETEETSAASIFKQKVDFKSQFADLFLLIPAYFDYIHITSHFRAFYVLGKVVLVLDKFSLLLC